MFDKLSQAPVTFADKNVAEEMVVDDDLAHLVARSGSSESESTKAA